jgi:hypothetical protein
MKNARSMVKGLARGMGYGTSFLLAGCFASSQTVSVTASTKQVHHSSVDSVQVSYDLPAKGKTVRPWQMERLIRALAGEWDTEDTFEPDGSTGGRTTAHSLETFRPGPNRLSLIEEYRGKDPGDRSRGLGVFWWEEASGGIHVLWCDNGTPESGCRLLSELGIWQSNNFVLTDVHRAANNELYRREVWSDLAADSFTQTIFQGESMDTMRKFLTIKAHRTNRLFP